MIDYLLVKCNNEECFYDISKPLNCAECKEGKLIDICQRCNKENEINFTWSKIDCECGASHIPCELIKYRIVKNEKNSNKSK